MTIDEIVNILRLDSCYGFLNLLERIQLHQSNPELDMYKEHSPSVVARFQKMTDVLNHMEWEVPCFNRVKYDEYERVYFTTTIEGVEVSEERYANSYRKYFDHFISRIS